MKEKRSRSWMFKMNKCKHCKEENKENARFCVNCGQELGTQKQSKVKHERHIQIDLIDSNFLKTSGRVIAYILFGIIALIALFTFSVKSLFALLLAGLGVFIALPLFNSFIEKKFKMKIPAFGKILALFILFTTTIILLSDSETPTKTLDDSDLEEMGAEEVLETYLSFFNYKGVSDRLDKINSEKKIASGPILELLQVDEDYLTEFKSIYTDEIRMCDEEKRMLGEDVCGEKFRDVLNAWEISYTRYFEIQSKNILEETPESVKIKVKHKVVYDTTFKKSEETGETTYILKKDGKIWKINDVIDDKGVLFSESFNAKNSRQENQEALNEIKESYNEFKKIFEKIKEVYVLRENLINKVKVSVPEISLISFELGNYNNQTGKYVVSIVYYYKREWLVDDYLGFMGDASKMYKTIFPANSNVLLVQLTAKQKYKNNYGTTEEKFLARSLMDKVTADKINWVGFESGNLDKVTSVEFYGDSFYKDLVDLRSSLDNWQNLPSVGGIGISGIGGIPSSVCGDAKEQCQRYGECDLLSMMESQGMC